MRIWSWSLAALVAVFFAVDALAVVDVPLGEETILTDNSDGAS